MKNKITKEAAYHAQRIIKNKDNHRTTKADEKAGYITIRLTVGGWNLILETLKQYEEQAEG